MPCRTRRDYSNLGAATSGATFFREIGAAFGVAICGSVFSGRLVLELRRVLAGVRLPSGFRLANAQANPAILKTLPPSVRVGVLHAYALSIDRIFLVAAPVAAAAFAVSWFLKEVPLRQTAGASDLSEGLGAGSAHRTSVEEIERALLRLVGGDMRRKGYERIAAVSGLDLPAGCCWVLARLAKHGNVAGPELAREAGVTVEHGRPYVDKLVERGMVQREEGMLLLTATGSVAAGRIFDAHREGLELLLAEWSPEQHAELARMLDRLSRALMGGGGGPASGDHAVGRYLVSQLTKGPAARPPRRTIGPCQRSGGRRVPGRSSSRYRPPRTRAPRRSSWPRLLSRSGWLRALR